MKNNKAISTVVEYKAGAQVVKENDTSRKMYIIKEGKARVCKKNMNQSITLAVLEPGEIFGELSFIDAKPRSASVEALTDLVLVVIDGDKEIAGWPNWLMPIFKTIVKRFREADMKISQLQGVYEFQKRGMKQDKIAQTIFLELLRFIKTFKILLNTASAKGADIDASGFSNDLENVLGDSHISFKVFWNVLKEQGWIDDVAEEKNRLVVNIDLISEFEDYLLAVSEVGNYNLFSHTSIAILKALISYNNEESTQDAEGESVILLEHLQLDKIPLFEEGLKELSEQKVIAVSDTYLSLNKEKVFKLCSHQIVLKAFDYAGL